MKKLRLLTAALLITLSVLSQTRTVNVGAGGAAPALGAVLGASTGQQTGSIDISGGVNAQAAIFSNTELSSKRYRVYNSNSSFYADIQGTNVTANYIQQLPNKPGTFVP